MFPPRNHHLTSRSRCAGIRTRRGAVLVLSAVLMTFMVALLAFSIDLGYKLTVQGQLDRATDAAALAGAGALIDGADAAQSEAVDFMLRNRVGTQLIAEEGNRAALLQEWLAEHGDDIDIAVGHWDPLTRTFRESSVLPSTIRVQTAYRSVPFVFAPVLGVDTFDVTAEAIARYQPRDIVLVLDFSASMNDDSELRRIYEYGEGVRATVEASLRQIYDELGAPVYGTMQFEPQYISSTDRTVIKNQLGLNNVPYPYPSGSWNDYINYVKSSYNYPAKAGYRKKYGGLTLVNYWLERRPKHSQTPDLWQVSAQPVSAVKDTVGVFMGYIQEVDSDDRVALVIYDSPSQNAVVERTLTTDFAAVEDVVDHRQAGHYDYYTNIGAGIHEAWSELDTHARVGAKKMIVLMTDGKANRPGGTSSGMSYALEQAGLAAQRHYPIVTISLGNGADTNLMQQIADSSNGVHFNVPGGGTVSDYAQELLGVFRQIADDRPLILVK